MCHFLNYMDSVYKQAVLDIKDKHPDWKIDKNFIIYKEIIPDVEGIVFKTKLQLKKKGKRTSVLFQQEFKKRKTRYYLSEYDIVRMLIYIFDTFKEESNTIYLCMCNLINDTGQDVSFKINDKKFKFKGIQYLGQNDKKILTHFDYYIGINDFISLLNLVIEKDRYSVENQHDKGTILKYIVFLVLFSKRSQPKNKSTMNQILKDKKIFIEGASLKEYKEIINNTGRNKLYFDTSLSDKILCYNIT
ncbi:hypothetical protein KM800_13535 [Clostridium tyrobutyricum]|uniref:hypothetical protein n=1 Tax=Clostridium tyrobutyricum TaxID=1519 RepID=UPI001C386A8A|nr:hypothetical protein [Clostridium tyrobutyricum]MBV4420328.1 hypothetical protein [Clostridium tyrobutyricum]